MSARIFHTVVTKDQETSFKSLNKLVWLGDLAGQNECRDKFVGFSILNAMYREQPYVAVFSGDMVYADNRCDERGLYGNIQVKETFKHQISKTFEHIGNITEKIKSICVSIDTQTFSPHETTMK